MKEILNDGPEFRSDVTLITHDTKSTKMTFYDLIKQKQKTVMLAELCVLQGILFSDFPPDRSDEMFRC